MYLYNSDNCHYDLLVDENSRLAILGLIDIGEEDVKVVEGGVEKTEEPRDGVMDKPKKEEERNEQWKTVKGSKNLNKPHSPVKQHKVTADSDEVVLTKQKSNGHNRASPQSEPISQKDHTSIVNLGQICDICSHVTDNTHDLEAHMDTHKKCQKEVSCNQCEESFEDNSDLKNHIENEHSKQWNCNDCDFQATTRQILLNHCKQAQGHHPSKRQKQRLGQTGVLECYTCQAEFRNYHDLMSHRKEDHPSNKTCRYYIKGECHFSAEECWYLHKVKPNSGDSDERNAEFQGFVCKNIFSSKYDLMEHKKKNHPSKILCTKFQKRECKRSSEDCRYLHVLSTSVPGVGSISSQNAPAQKLSSVWQQDFPQLPPTTAPNQEALIMALNMVNQSLQALGKIFPRLI